MDERGSLHQEFAHKMGRELKVVLGEAVVIAAIGLAFALVANLVSPRGLSLGRDYFPGSGSATPLPTPPGAGSGVSLHGSQGQGPQETVIARLKEKGLQPIDGKEAIQLFRDPQYQQDLIVFVDARDDHHYQEGHIPGAYQFDRYYPEKYLPAVLLVCLNAAKVMVYCAGGDCEDSEFAALALKDAGVQQERLFVYAGGITEWSTNGVPVEVGGRKSGNMRDSNEGVEALRR
jgi:rhodanese-related sulfurtransferase